MYARGGEAFIGAYHYLDYVPKGRDEDGLAFTMSWVRHHDRYDADYKIDPARFWNVAPAKRWLLRGPRSDPAVSGYLSCSADIGVPVAGPGREQPHFVLGPKSTCYARGPCGAKQGAPFAATRERALCISHEPSAERRAPRARAERRGQEKEPPCSSCC